MVARRKAFRRRSLFLRRPATCGAESRRASRRPFVRRANLRLSPTRPWERPLDGIHVDTPAAQPPGYLTVADQHGVHQLRIDGWIAKVPKQQVVETHGGRRPPVRGVRASARIPCCRGRRRARPSRWSPTLGVRLKHMASVRDPWRRASACGRQRLARRLRSHRRGRCSALLLCCARQAISRGGTGHARRCQPAEGAGPGPGQHRTALAKGMALLGVRRTHAHSIDPE